jgi:anti-sigma factor RsiW
MVEEDNGAQMNHSDEMLMAYVDGELSPDAASRVAVDLARDPAIAARVAAFEASRRAVADSHPLEPVSDDLVARIRGVAAAARAAEAADSPTPAASTESTNVIAFAGARKVPFWQLPVAASIALVAGLSVSLLRQDGTTPADVGFGLDNAAGLTAALGSVPSGEEVDLPGGRLAVIASFEGSAGALCREFEFDETGGRTVISVACRQDADWQMQFAVAASADDSGYAPASSLDSLDAWLMAIDAGPPMDAEAEAAALGR